MLGSLVRLDPAQPYIRLAIDRDEQLPWVPSVHNLRGERAGIEIRHEATDFSTFYFQDAHTFVRDGVAVGGASDGLDLLPEN